MTARNGSAEWHGNVQDGAGTVTVGNGVFQGAYSYGSRFGEEEGTNPEQLIAAAHAACFTMALSSILSAAGHAPESLRTNARPAAQHRPRADPGAHRPGCGWAGGERRSAAVPGVRR